MVVWLRIGSAGLLAAAGVGIPAASAVVMGRGPVAGCSATAASLTPSGWQAPAHAAREADRGPLRLVRDIPLPGPPNRFDYQSVDPAGGRLYISHMGVGRLIVFDLDAERVIHQVPGVPRATGVLAVPRHDAVYVSAPGAHEVAVVSARRFAITARIGGIHFPDGIAYAPKADRVFVSDESGGTDVVIDARTNTKRSVIRIGGQIGNTHYDSVSQCILVAAEGANQLVAIDPGSERVIARYDLPGADGPHGFTLDQVGRLAFISCEGNAKLLVLDLRTMRVLQTFRVGDDPDVLAWDPGWRRLYVASEAGVVSSFVAEGDTLRLVGETRAARAHSVAVDPRTHRVYLPLQDVGGRPVLRVMMPDSR